MNTLLQIFGEGFEQLGIECKFAVAEIDTKAAPEFVLQALNVPFIRMLRLGAVVRDKPVNHPIGGIKQIFSLIVALKQLPAQRSEEHTSELQSHVNLVCRLL